MVLNRMGRVALSIESGVQFGSRWRKDLDSQLSDKRWMGVLVYTFQQWRDLDLSLVTDDLSSSGRAVFELNYGKDTFRSIQVVS